MALPASFLTTPIAHRAFHDKANGRPENSRAAVRAAVDAGYGIEIDIQPSADGVPMVFHDYDLKRLTGVSGPIAGRNAQDLGQTRLLGGDEGIPTLAEVLDLIAGRVPLLIEIKDQDGALGPNVGTLQDAVAAALADYTGDVAVMSFNPHTVAAFGKVAPNVPRGLTTCLYPAEDWPLVPAATRERLAGTPDFDAVGACFISHDQAELFDGRVAELKAAGVPILCWTVRSPEVEANARKIADNITFEGYNAPFLAPAA